MTHFGKTLLLGLATSSLAFGAFASADPAAAQFKSLHDAVRKVDDAAKKANEAAETAEDVVETVTGNRRSTRRSGRSNRGFANRGSTSNSPRTAAAPDHVGGAGATPSRFTSQLSCASLGLGNAFVGRGGDYTFSKGINTETRGGIIDRTNVKPTNGCLFEGLGVGDILYVEFDKSRFKKYSYDMQCVAYDGSEQLDNTNGPRTFNFSGKDVMLHTGNSLGYTPTASGSNSDRSGAYDKYLDGRGRAMATINFGALHTDKSGTDFFCQWFDESSGKSALALTFRRGPAG